MKILKIFGIVVGIHVFALILIFANPGCNSTAKPAPSPNDTLVTPAPAPASSATPPPNVYSSVTDATTSAPPVTFRADAPAASGGPRGAPMRPGSVPPAALPADGPAEATPVTTYTVKNNDSLWVIARKNNLTVAQLAGANGISTTAPLKPGQVLKVPTKPASAVAAPAGATAAPAPKGSAAKNADTAVATAAARASSDGIKHVVKTGETLGGIARTYGVKQRDLAVANNLSDPGKLKPGMELVVPGWKSPASTGKASTKSGSSTSKSASAPASAAPAAEPAPAIETPPAPAPSSLPPVPVIRLDDGPAPAPKVP